jgi:diacylglycerol kinase (ATP)
MKKRHIVTNPPAAARLSSQPGADSHLTSPGSQVLKTVAIVNPAAGFGKAARVWPRLLEDLGPRPDPPATWWTEGPGHGEFLAARARQQGYERVLAVGGDGTIHEVANGLWWEPRGLLPSLGLVPLGTGCDYVRNFFRGAHLVDALAQALGESTVAVAVGLIRVQGFNGRPLDRIGLNVCGLGFDAGVVSRRRRQKLPLAGRAPYFISALQELVMLKHFRLSGRLDEEPFAAHSSLLVAALGRYFGGGLKIAPQASPQGGRFQVVWDDNLSRLAVLSLFGKTFSGGHLAHSRVHSRFARHLAVSADPPARVQVEGEPVGLTPLTVRLAPEKLRVAAR